MDIFSSPILVYLANGVQGRAVVQAGLRQGLQVRALVRDKARAMSDAASGAELVEGDLFDVSSLMAASHGAGYAVLHIPTGPTEMMQEQARNVMTASVAAGLRGVILKLASASRLPPCEEPSFLANGMIEEIVRQAGLPFAFVRPTMYLDNLLKPSALKDIVGYGHFSPPIHATQRIAWTSADDCGAAAITILKRGSFYDDYRIAGPDAVTGEELSAKLSRGLGRPVAYREQSPDNFEQEVDEALGAGIGARVASKFHFFARHPAEADRILATSYRPMPGLEGFFPQRIEEWIRSHREAFSQRVSSNA